MVSQVILIAKTTYFFSCQPCHNGNTRNIRRPSSDTVLGRRYVYECGFGDLGELAKTDAVAKEDFGDGSEDHEERIKNLFLYRVLHAR